MTRSIESYNLANQPKIKYKLKPQSNFWKYKLYSVAVLFLVRRITSPFTAPLEVTAVLKNTLSGQQGNGSINKRHSKIIQKCSLGKILAYQVSI